MASKADIEVKVKELVESLGKYNFVVGDTYDELSTQLVQLKQESKALAALAKAQAKLDKEKAEADATSDEELPKYTVAAGRSLTSLKGIIDAGGEITEKHFVGGKVTIAVHVKSGVIVDNG